MQGFFVASRRGGPTASPTACNKQGRISTRLVILLPSFSCTGSGRRITGINHKTMKEDTRAGFPMKTLSMEAHNRMKRIRAAFLWILESLVSLISPLVLALIVLVFIKVNSLIGFVLAILWIVGLVKHVTGQDWGILPDEDVAEYGKR